MEIVDKPDPKDTAHIHILSAPWGIGTYRLRFEDGTEDMQYGFYRTENPHDFYPDHECCSEKEIANHKAACDWWDTTHPKG